MLDLHHNLPTPLSIPTVYLDSHICSILEMILCNLSILLEDDWDESYANSHASLLACLDLYRFIFYLLCPVLLDTILLTSMKRMNGYCVG